MMKLKLHTAVLALFISAGLLSSCTKSEYSLPVDPSQPAYANELRDDFNSDTHNWSYTDFSTESSIYISNGYLYYTSHPNVTTGNITALLTTGISASANYLVEANVGSDNIVGVLYGANDVSKGFSFKIDKIGRYALYNEGDDTTVAWPVIDWQPSGNVVDTKGQNILKMEQQGSKWNGYINNVLVFSIPAKPIWGNKVGFILKKGTNAKSDYLEVKW